MNLVLVYPPCSTCRKALAWLDARGAVYETRHIRDEPPTRAELAEWHARSGLPLKRFFNTSGLVYRGLGLSSRLPSMSEAEQLDLLASDGMLVRRPLLIADRGACPGFDAGTWAELLG